MRRAKQAKPQAGFTLIEVMMAMTVLMIGAMGLFALQATTYRSTQQSREILTASEIARVWAERVKFDAVSWTTGAPDAAAAVTNLTGTRWLKLVPADGSLGAWFTPSPPTSGSLSAPSAMMTPSADYYGRFIWVTGAVEPTYCTQLRLQWVYPGQAMRVDVRVWWRRRANSNDPGIGSMEIYPDCGAGESPATLSADRRLRFVNNSLVVRWTRLFV